MNFLKKYYIHKKMMIFFLMLIECIVIGQDILLVKQVLKDLLNILEDNINKLKVLFLIN